MPCSRFDPFDRLRVLSESKDKLTTLSKVEG